MSITAGIDVGSTYTKVILLDGDNNIIAKVLRQSGFKLKETSLEAFEQAISDAGVTREDIAYVVATGMGRHQAEFKNIHVTDITASARGATLLFPGTRTLLDVGGQTLKASRLNEDGSVKSFRLNDKCAAGTGAFIEKTARYMGYGTEEIGPMMATAKDPVSISGVCAVFAESEVINHLSLGTPPADIMQGAIESLTTRCVQLMRRVKGEKEYTLTGGILRFRTMGTAVSEQLGEPVNVPDEDTVQFIPALGAAVLGQQRLAKLATA